MEWCIHTNRNTLSANNRVVRMFRVPHFTLPIVCTKLYLQHGDVISCSIHWRYWSLCKQYMFTNFLFSIGSYSVRVNFVLTLSLQESQSRLKQSDALRSWNAVGGFVSSLPETLRNSRELKSKRQRETFRIKLRRSVQDCRSLCKSSVD